MLSLLYRIKRAKVWYEYGVAPFPHSQSHIVLLGLRYIPYFDLSKWGTFCPLVDYYPTSHLLAELSMRGIRVISDSHWMSLYRRLNLGHIQPSLDPDVQYRRKASNGRAIKRLSIAEGTIQRKAER